MAVAVVTTVSCMPRTAGRKASPGPAQVAADDLRAHLAPRSASLARVAQEQAQRNAAAPRAAG